MSNKDEAYNALLRLIQWEMTPCENAITNGDTEDALRALKEIKTKLQGIANLVRLIDQ